MIEANSLNGSSDCGLGERTSGERAVGTRGKYPSGEVMLGVEAVGVLVAAAAETTALNTGTIGDAASCFAGVGGRVVRVVIGLNPELTTCRAPDI